MQIRFVDGWPYRRPRFLVDGVSADHTNAAGEICLWDYSTRTRAWMTLKGVKDRVDEWLAAVEAGFPDDIVLDAHLYFERRHAGMATVQLGDVGRQPGGIGRINGSWHKGLTLQLSNRGGDHEVAGRWFTLGRVPTPPRTVDDVLGLMEVNQADSFRALLKAAAAGKGDRIALLTWETPKGPNALTLLQRLVDQDVRVEALETAPTDQSYLAARAGPDFPSLQDARIVLFGAGALGSHLAVRLAECGLGALTIHDGDVIRPGNVARHVARRDQVGLPKRIVVKEAIDAHVPWTTVAFGDETWDPSELKDAIENAHLVLDATGNGAFTDLVSEVCRREQTSLLSTALYRGGAVGRICRQAKADDEPICDRHLAPDPRYPLIPRGDEPSSLEPGCTSPVNNAPPSVVAALAGRTAEIAIDTLSGRLDYGDEFIEVYRALDEAPFDQVGAVRLDR